MKKLVIILLICLCPILSAQEDEFDYLMSVANEQLAGLLSLEIQMNSLVEQADRLSKNNTELQLLLNDASSTIVLLRGNLEIALDRIGDAEGGALALLDENTQLFELAKKQTARIRQLEGQLKRAPYAGLGFGIGIGSGTVLMIDGITQNNQTLTYTGLGVAVGSAGIWALGHFVFSWW